MKYFIFFVFLFLCLINLAENKKNYKGKSNKRFNAVNHKSEKNNKPHPRQTCLSTDCVDTAVSYLKVLKDKIGNFEKQFSRMKVQNKTGKSKAGKNGIFGSVIRRLVRAGGGNASNLSCSGNSNSSGAEKMNNLTSSLLSCETNIKTSCDTSNLPQPNMTAVEDCMEKMSSFKAGVLACMKKTGSEACSCWTEASLGKDLTSIKKCDLSKQSKSMAKAVSGCRNAFGACRKLEDEIGLSIHACTQDTTALVKKLKTLKENKAALSSLSTKLSSVVNGTRSLTKATTVTCTAFKEKINFVLNLITQNPSSGRVSRLILKITVVTVVCTTAEKAELSSLSTSIASAETAITEDETSVQSTLTTLSGTTASSSLIESATSCEDNCETAVSSVDSESSTNSTSKPITSSIASNTSSSTPSNTTSMGNNSLTQKPINMNSVTQKPTNMNSLTQKPINMNSPPQKPINMTSPPQKPINMNSPPQKPINMNSPTSDPNNNGQKPVHMISPGTPPNNQSEIQTPEPLPIKGSTGLEEKPTNIVASGSTDQFQGTPDISSKNPSDFSPGGDTSPAGSLLTTRSSYRKARDTVELQIKNAKMSFN